MGYYKDGKPYGKWVCYDVNGNEWWPKGIYMGQKRCLEQKEFDDFLINEEPNPIAEMNDQDKIQALYKEQKDWVIKKDRYDVVINKKVWNIY